MTENIYQEKIKSYNDSISRYQRKSRLYLTGKLSAFIAAVISGYFCYNDTDSINVLLVAIFVLLYFFFCVIDDHCQTQSDKLKSMRAVCYREINCLHGIYTDFETGEEYINPQHEFSFDLDIFGVDSFFNRISRTVTKGGKDKLASKLSTISLNKEEIMENQESIAELSTHIDWRIQFQANKKVEFHIAPFSGLSNPTKLQNFLFTTHLPHLIIACTAVSFILCSTEIISWHYFSTFFLIQILLAIIVGKTSAKATKDTSSIHQQFKIYLSILRQINGIEFHSAKLVRIKKGLFGDKENSIKAFNSLNQIVRMLDQRGNIIMYVLLNGTCMLDIMLIRMFIKWNKKYAPYLPMWMDSIAEIDALASLATYAFNHPENSTPEILEQDSEFIVEAKGIYHPFLSHKKAVPNDFSLQKKNITIVTGANMAGKSTFLRTVGITYLMASIGLPVCARKFSFSNVTLFSSMRTSDNLTKDISYFNAELLRLKQLILHVKSHHYTLIILDEILKGTNSKDKLEGSVMFLHEISRYNVSAVIATHDLELSKLEEKEGNIYSNYCFEIELKEDIEYSYKIQKGVAKNLNASYLLANILKSM